MKNLLFIAILLLTGSCSVFKTSHKNMVQSETHRDKDSTIIYERLHTKEIKTIGDTSNVAFLLSQLIANGMGIQKDGDFTTEVRLKDGVLEVTTTLDEITQRLTELEQEKTVSKTNEIVFVDSKEKNSTMEKKDYTMLMFFGFLFIILLFGLAFVWFAIRKYLKSRPF